MISRSTWIWLAAWVVLTAGVYADAQGQRWLCERSIRHMRAASLQDDDGGGVTLDPCTNMWRETYWWGKRLVLSWLAACVGLLRSVIRDMVRWVKSRRGRGASAAGVKVE